MEENNHMVHQNGDVDTNKVENVMGRMSSERKDDILQNFNSFKNYLGDKMELGQKLGMNEEMLAKTAEKVAGYLAANEEPRNREEYLLQQLWLSGEQDQRHQLAHLLVRMVQKEQ
ncbi:DUF3243 domain-containing protein [Aneurinibacillus tyrosinisolvens]|uniref:DUF3243 domain-containing protein n=1 Tax=Aneurinibacillus tyrosinisolvens TaxID=1443435 RepID=UPI00063FD207|nr:DUF3243 domain-containing protein [Aneurinibacillus tyrosinisolvens]